MMPAARVAAGLLCAAAKCESLPPAALLEIAAFAEATKPSLRFVVSPKDSAILVSTATELGFAARSRGIFLSPVNSTWNDIVLHPTDKRAEVVVIGHDHNADRLLAAELSDASEAGILLGYPECCVRSLPQLAAKADKWTFALLSNAGPRIDARLNRFAAAWGGIGVIGELFPCSLYCRAAASYSQSLYDAARALGLTQLAAAARSDALAAVAIDADGQVSRAGSSHEATVEFFW